MSDLLSSASLLLTFIAILYGLWYPEIRRDLDTLVPDQSLDRKIPRQKVQATLYNRALPLAIATVALTLVFVPDTLRIILISISHTYHDGLRAILDYNAVSAALVLVTLSTALFAYHLVFLVSKLRSLLRRLAP